MTPELHIGIMFLQEHTLESISDKQVTTLVQKMISAQNAARVWAEVRRREDLMHPQSEVTVLSNDPLPWLIIRSSALLDDEQLFHLVRLMHFIFRDIAMQSDQFHLVAFYQDEKVDWYL